MRLATGSLSHWRVTLRDGSAVDVWADVVTGLSGSEDERDYEFGCLIDLEPEEHPAREEYTMDLRIRDGVVVMVARFPRASVADVTSM